MGTNYYNPDGSYNWDLFWEDKNKKDRIETEAFYERYLRRERKARKQQEREDRKRASREERRRASGAKTVLEVRQNIERCLVRRLVSSKKEYVSISELPRNNQGRILSFTPYEFDQRTSEYCVNPIRYQYSNLSKQIHRDPNDPRNRLAKQIRDILQIHDDLDHILFADIGSSYDQYVEYCTLCREPFRISKDKYRFVQRLIQRWQSMSQELHYSASKQEKRKLKKLEAYSNRY